jgi:hypothetical protein
MAISVFPAASASSGTTPNFAQTFTADSANTIYLATASLSVGTYTITCVSSTIARVTFLNGNAEIVTANTASGTVTVNLATPATGISYLTNTGTSVVISITLTGSPITATAPSGTLETITTSQTPYTRTGKAYVVVVGAGGNGGGGSANGGYSGGGGGSGGVSSSYMQLTGNINIVIGAISATNVRGSGGATSIGALTVNGGGPGDTQNGGGSAGSPGGGGGGNGAQGNSGQNGGGASTASAYNFAVSGTTGGGGGGSAGGNGSGAGSGIGTGGSGRNNTNGSGFNNANGYGAGGAGSWPGNNQYPTGTPGVVYVVYF